MEITYQLTKEEFIRMNNIYARHINKLSKVLIWFYYLAGVILILHALYNIISTWSYLVSSSEVLYSLVFVGEMMIGCLIILAGHYSATLTAKRWIKKPNNQVAFEKVTLRLDDQGIIYDNERHEYSRISWQSVGMIYETNDFFLFEFTERQISTIPKRDLTPLEQEELVRILERNYTKKIRTINA